MLDTRMSPLPDIAPASTGLKLGDTTKYQGSDSPNLPYYSRSRKRGTEQKKKQPHYKDPHHQVDLVA